MAVGAHPRTGGFSEEDRVHGQGGFLRQHGLFIGIGILVAALLAMLGPLATNDGPVHVSFAHLLDDYGRPGWPLQTQVYRLDHGLEPNMTGYAILRVLMHVVSPATAETLLQLICILAPVAGARFAIRQIEPRNQWLALCVFPLAANYLFYLGLYNFLLSVAAFFVAVGLYFRMVRRPSLGVSLWLAASLFIALLSHAAGFVMAELAIGTMTAVPVVIALAKRTGVSAALRAQWAAWLGLALPVPLLLMFASQHRGAPTAYGVPLLQRLRALAMLDVLRSNSILDRLFALLLAGALVAAAASFMRDTLKKRHGDPRGAHLRQWPPLVALLMICALTLLVPDTSGGGWNHFDRASLFPFFWMLICGAHLRYARRSELALTGAMTVCAVGLLCTAALSQWQAKRQMQALAAVDAHVGAHCTVLPIVSKLRPDAGHWLRTTYAPFFQAASRLELGGDRVVLFNFLARLSVYPVRYQPGRDPQRLIFGWAAGAEEPTVRRVDIDAFERTSGLAVDYVLVWGDPPADADSLARDTQRAVRDAPVVYRSPDRMMTLYRRPQGEHSACTASPPAQTVAESRP
jgi:hypothetical protein